jgi:trans-2,3-dihydro-3-hydroxyanthranilate isomerase
VRRRFVTVDVFTSKMFGGNPLAVVLDAERLSTDQMQAVAREFNYAETTFVLPPADPANTARVRIFTPGRELPFAGHPNVGTAFALAQLGKVQDQARFEEGAGLVPVDLLHEAGVVVGAELLAPQPLAVGPALDAATIAAMVSLEVAEVRRERHEPCVASVGLPFVIAELASRAALSRAAPDITAFRRVLPVGGADAVLLYTRGDGAACDLHARVFSTLDGIGEDPATGSANAALVALLAHLAPEQDAEVSLRVAQGEDMGRPSLLQSHAEKRLGRVGAVRVGGRCVAVMEGTLALQ